MKQNANHITLEEAEQLCRLYMDCQLSVLEETELEYVLMPRLCSVKPER